MKTRTKALLLTLCAVLLVTASVMGTMAYLTSNDSVTNTFTVGQVKITMDETDVDNSTPDKDRDQANSYKLMPGHEYTKDPIIHVASTSEDCYLFVKVVNEIADIEDTATTVASQMAAKGWKAVDNVDNVYVYVGTAEGATNPLAVSADSNITVFEKFKVDDSVSNDKDATHKLSDYANKTITVTAYAVQTDGFEGQTAVQIWNTAFNTTTTPETPETDA